MATKKLICTADVSISQKYSGQAYNSADRLAFGSGSSSSDTYYALLNFSSLGLSNTAYKVTNATLIFSKIDGAIGYNASFYARAVRITSSWSESTTYDTQPSVTTTGASASVSVGAGHSGSVSLDVTSIVQSWLAGNAQYGVRLEKTTSGTSLLKCIGSRTSSSAAYIIVTYEAKAPAPTTPTVTAPGTITSDSKVFSWTASIDHIYASSSLSYQLQVSLDGGSTWGSTYTASAGKTNLAVNLRTLAGLSSGQYYYNAKLKVRVRAVTPSHNGTVYYSSWGTSSTGIINYKITPTKPSSLAVSPASAYEGAAVTVTLGRPSSYNTLTSGGATNTLTYYVKLANGTTLGSVKAAVTSATASLNATLGNLTSGNANLSTSITAYCVDAHSQTSPSTSAVSLTVYRYRAPVISITGIDRAAESATATVAVTDTGYSGIQSSGQISAVAYTIDGGATWETVTPTWVGLKTAVEITGLSANTRYALQVRVTNVAPDGLTAKSVTYKATILEHTPAAMIFRDSANGASGIAAKSLIVGEDWSGQVSEGDASIEGTVTAYRLIAKDTNYPTLQFMDSDDGSVKAQVLGNMSRNITYFRNWCTDSGYYENYLTPDPDTGRTKNGNYSILTTKETADYVVAQGTSGGWRYQKWSSGKAVCSRTISNTPTVISGANLVTVTLPFSFASTSYTVQITKAANGFLVTDVIDANGAQNSGHTAGNFIVTYKYSSGTAYPVSFNISVAGSWK